MSKTSLHVHNNDRNVVICNLFIYMRMSGLSIQTLESEMKQESNEPTLDLRLEKYSIFILIHIDILGNTA